MVQHSKCPPQCESNYPASALTGVHLTSPQVGGAMFDAAINHMNKNGRIAIIGGISGYNSLHEPPKGKNSNWFIASSVTVKNRFA